MHSMTSISHLFIYSFTYYHKIPFKSRWFMFILYFQQSDAPLTDGKQDDNQRELPNRNCYFFP